MSSTLWESVGVRPFCRYKAMIGPSSQRLRQPIPWVPRKPLTVGAQREGQRSPYMGPGGMQNKRLPRRRESDIWVLKDE